MGQLFTKILKDAGMQGKVPGRPDSRDWFRDKAQATARANPKRLMLQGNKVKMIQPGKMYSFFYDPKTKDTLPYYDTFPLIFPFSLLPQHFIGINMHYLPPLLRARLMDALYDLVGKRITEDSKLRISYGILQGASRFKLFQPTIHKYLYSHMRSNFLEIPADQWDIALMLPTERFVKAGKRRVWNESRDKV